MVVPNTFPSLPSNLRVALIGEAPGKDEESLGKPFVGASGRFLNGALSRAGIARDACFLGNVAQVRPDGNKIVKFKWDGPEIQEGLKQLEFDITALNPNVIVLLGNVALKVAKDPYTVHTLHPKAFRFKNHDWRGTLFFPATGPLRGRKCIATFHPAFVLRGNPEAGALLLFDLKRAVREGESPYWEPPKRTMEVDLDFDTLCSRLKDLQARRRLVSIDIEGGVNTMSCISFADAPNHAFIVPFFKKGGIPCWTPDQELILWRLLASVLEDRDVPKVLQNSLYDRFILQYCYHIRVNGVVDDTMLKHWELYSELPKALGVQASIYTEEPYWKAERKTQDDKTFYEYCCKDSAVTMEINGKLSDFLHPTSKQHYKLNMALLNPLLYMELRGIRYNINGAATRRSELQHKQYGLQAKLNGWSGHYISTHSEILSRARDLMAFKNASVSSFEDVQANAKKDYLYSSHRLHELMKQPNPTLSTIGEIEDLLEVSLNVKSIAFQDFLYGTLKLPEQFNKKKDEETGEDTRVRTADEGALLKLSKITLEHPDSSEHKVVSTAMQVRSLRTRAQMLSISADADNRIRCGYNLVGTNTGRITCYTSPTGSGYNLQTIPDDDRDLFLADDDHWFFQCDLSGADGWTVAAYSAMLGDTTMLDDYRFGLSPFVILTLYLRGTPCDFKSRESIKSVYHTVDKKAWDRFALKRVQHGGCYLEGGETIAKNILEDSEGKFTMPEKECLHLRDKVFFARYPGVRLWHQWVARRLSERPVLVAASGQVRRFFGHPNEILPKAVAFEPQANTTYATNLAMYRLWTDVDNRIGTSDRQHLKVEPLHQVHDALAGQFQKSDTSWAVGKVQSWFNNALTIAQQRIVIPFDGGYGPSWGDTSVGKI